MRRLLILLLAWSLTGVNAVAAADPVVDALGGTAHEEAQVQTAPPHEGGAPDLAGDGCCHYCHAMGHLAGLLSGETAAAPLPSHGGPVLAPAPSLASRTWAPPTPPPNA